MSQSSTPYVFAVISGALWQGMIGVFVKWIPWPPFPLVCVRCAFASVALWCLVRFRNRPAGTSASSLRDKLLGGALLAGHWTTLFWGYRIAQVGPVLVAVFTYPVITSIAEPLVHGRRPSSRQFVTALIGASGVAAMVLPGSALNETSTNTPGVLLGLVSAVLFAARNIHARSLLQKTDAVVLMAWQVTVVTALLCPSLVLLETHALTLRTIGLVAVLGVAFTALPHTLHVWALNGLSAAALGIIGSLQVLSGIVLAAWLVDEAPRPAVWLGAVCVIAAVALETLFTWRARSQLATPR